MFFRDISFHATDLFLYPIFSGNVESDKCHEMGYYESKIVCLVDHPDAINTRIALLLIDSIKKNTKDKSDTWFSCKVKLIKKVYQTMQTGLGQQV